MRLVFSTARNHLPRLRFRTILRYRPRISPKSSLSLTFIAALTFTAWTAGANVAAGGPLFVSPAGNDANDCQTFATACRTIGAAITKALAGDTLIIASGMYTEGVTLDKNLTLIGFGSDATI